MSDFFVDPDRFARSARQFDALADELLQLHMRLGYRQQAEGKCWGSDEPGRNFAEGYEPGVRKAADNAETLTDVLGAIAETMRSSATEFDATDQRNTRTMRWIEEGN